MKRAFFLLLIAATAAAQPLATRIGRLLAQSPARTAFWGIQATDLATGRTLYELNSRRFFVPASNTKLFSTSLALMRLGGAFTFQTRVMADAAPDSDGKIDGGLRLLGGGDPNLSGRAIPYRVGQTTGDPLASLADLADQVAAQGVRRVDGDIIGDDSWYVWEPYGNGWGIDDPLYDYGAPVSALTLNDNAFTLSIRPGAKMSDPAALMLHPAVEYYAIDNRIVTSPAGSARQVHYSRSPGSRTLQLWGAIPIDDGGEDLLLGIEDPALYAALAFRQALEERGITVNGHATTRHLYTNEVTDPKHGVPTETIPGVQLAIRQSAPLIEDLRITAKVSQNLHAELALRAVGRDRRNVGSVEAGLDELKSFLAEAGVPADGYNINDGSGLARLNLVTPATVVALLRYMYASPARENFLSILPVGGEDGTLNQRFTGTALAGRIFAKTGSLTHVNALSGYIHRKRGGWVAFSMLVNNYNGPAADVRAAMDRICELLSE